MVDWPIGLSTGCFYRTDIRDCLADIEAIGFHQVEVCSSPDHLDYHHPAEVTAAADQLAAQGLEVHSFHAPFADDIDITAPDPTAHRRALDEIHAAADAAAVCGAECFVLHPGPERDDLSEAQRLPRMERGARTLERIADRCRSLGLTLMLENMLPHLFTGRIRDLLWLLGALDRTDVGVCLDTGHAFLAGDLDTIVQKLTGHLWMVHANDNRGHGDDHLPPGEGEIDWAAFCDHLARVSFHGTLILEIAARDEHEGTLAAARRGRRYLRECQRRLRNGN